MIIMVIWCCRISFYKVKPVIDYKLAEEFLFNLENWLHMAGKLFPASEWQLICFRSPVTPFRAVFPFLLGAMETQLRNASHI